MQKRAASELGTTFHYRQIDVRNVPELNEIIRDISDKEGRMDGLIAAAGIQQETTALDYSAKDANTMFEVNITGVFMTAQAVAKEMIRWGNGGSMAFIASMSGTIANRVSFHSASVFPTLGFPHLLYSVFQLPNDANKVLRRASSAPPTTPVKQA